MMNTVLMQGYTIKLEWHASMLDFAGSTTGTEHGLTNEEWHAKRESLRGHYFWIASIKSHGEQKHVALKSGDIGPDDSPGYELVTFMRAVGVALGDLARADAKELVPEPASA